MTSPETERGQYIVIEGMDGAGKTTQAKLLYQHLGSIGIKALKVREPGGTKLGEALRGLILDGDLQKSPYSDFDMFTIARRELRDQVIRPATEKGDTVISDRCWFSSFAYQGYGEGLDTDYIESRSRDALFYKSYVEPRGVIIDIEPELIYKRISVNEAKADTFEKKGIQFYSRVREGYERLAVDYGMPIIDGAQSEEAVHQDILKALKFEN